MEITTEWVRAPESKSGLDHLSAQAPCISVYQQLLPGITNVTYRARCYSLYPWLIWSFDKRYPKAKADKIRTDLSARRLSSDVDCRTTWTHHRSG
jgi:hypothetical protein